ncbi:uncharacterized protein LOC129749329 [Uranotaenia lowii]|uniref:uncharacterized protein LOC129749329 n=1 Tax=Uranotaenia lowii TaxID=190385 RepID=UPI00247978F9|nr:uncharacterized protein LOC129749329 [Uranotaenia lowii]
MTLKKRMTPKSQAALKKLIKDSVKPTKYRPLFWKLNVSVLLICFVFKYLPREDFVTGEHLTQQCEYDTRELCADCFRETTDCDFFRQRIRIRTDDLANILIDPFDPQRVLFAQLDGQQSVVVRNLNLNSKMESLRNELCRELNITRSDCRLANDERFLKRLRRRVLDKSVVDGCTVCPSGDMKALGWLLLEFTETELLDLLLIRTNAQPLMLKMLGKHGFPVPKLIFQGGFTLIESDDGQTMNHFYNSPLKVRLKIALALLEASLQFTDGVGRFRFYLTDISPSNIAVQVLASGKVQVSFLDLANIFIVDRQSERIADQQKAVHTRIECDRCIAFVKEELCFHQESDINSFATCNLLWEDYNGYPKGFLHNEEEYHQLAEIETLLDHCVQCVPPKCQDRHKILQNIQRMIRLMLAY